MKKTINGHIGGWNILCIDVSVKSTETKTFSKYIAAIDTGAYPCMIKKGLVDSLNLKHSKFDTFNTALDGQIQVPAYNLDISLDGIVFTNLEFNLFPSGNPPFDILLGMSFLKDFDIIYQGKDKKFEISFYHN